MGWMASFFGQPSKRYRNHQIAFLILTLNFVLPAVSYTFFPKTAIDQFLQVNSILGGAPYSFPEEQSRVWRYLGAANVMTLGFMCFLLMFNIKKFFIVIIPLTFMKAYAATCWLVGWAFDPGARFFLAAAVLDYVTSAAFVYFGVGAWRDIRDRPDGDLVPPPGWKRTG
ncbi:MAG: hypothetical protein HY897_01480 [Deltaproteobacteria bacterium]|nr:hypothetical protein [Deltaproteobacteria bacterium]